MQLEKLTHEAETDVEYTILRKVTMKHILILLVVMRQDATEAECQQTCTRKAPTNTKITMTFVEGKETVSLTNRCREDSFCMTTILTPTPSRKIESVNQSVNQSESFTTT